MIGVVVVVVAMRPLNPQLLRLERASARSFLRSSLLKLNQSNHHLEPTTTTTTTRAKRAKRAACCRPRSQSAATNSQIRADTQVTRNLDSRAAQVSLARQATGDDDHDDESRKLAASNVDDADEIDE